jgi:hypothetical protein
MKYTSKKYIYPCNRPWRPIGLCDFEAPTFSLDNRLTDGGEVVSLTRGTPFTRRNKLKTNFQFFAVCLTNFTTTDMCNT